MWLNLSLTLELKELVQLHGGKKGKENEEPLSKDEVLIVKVTYLRLITLPNCSVFTILECILLIFFVYCLLVCLFTLLLFV